VEPEIGGFIGLNREMGRRRFKEYKRRGAGKPKPLLVPPPSKAKSKAAKKPVVYDSGSDVETVNSDFGDTNVEIDTYSDSSSDEDDESLATREVEWSRFDPCDPKRIPQTTHYFPHPALDLESYMISKDIVDNDRVMAYYAKTWGPKASRKKNKKQDITKQNYQRFEKAQRDYLSSNPRLPRVERENEEGYKWTLVEADDNDGEKDGWKLSLKGDDPDSHLIPRIVELAKQDNEMMASKQLFEMKNPGFKKHSRTWVDNASFLTCYQIPKLCVLAKIDLTKKAGEMGNTKTSSERNEDFQQHEEYCINNRFESVDEEMDKASWKRYESNSSLSALCRFADVAATAPVLSDDFRLVCQNSKGLFEPVSGDSDIPPFKSRMVTKYLFYDLSPHNDFPRELFRLLQNEEGMLDHVLCWQKTGRSFIVKDRLLFEKIVLHQCCNSAHVTFQSFLTTLMSYGFSEIQIGKRRGGYRHNLFQRGKPKRLDQLIREGINILQVDTRADDSVAKVNTAELVDQPVVQARNAGHSTFIGNLYQLLRKSKSLGLDDTIHWEESGKSFKVHKLNKKIVTVLKNCLLLPLYSNFKAELIDRGFKCKEGKKYGIFENPNFVRGQRGVSGTFEALKLKRKKRRIEVKPIEAEPIETQPITKQKVARRKRKIKAEPTKTDAIEAEQKVARRKLKIDAEPTVAEPIVAESDVPLKKYDITVHSRFPKVLYDILEESSDRGVSDCIRWVPKGDALFVTEPSLFEANFFAHAYQSQASFDI